MGERAALRASRMLLCTEGCGRVTVDAQAFSLRAGTLLFCFAGETVTAEGDGEFSYMYIDFHSIRAEGILCRFDITPPTRVREGMDGLIPLWQESLYLATDKTVDLAAEGVLLLSLLRLGATLTRESGLVAEIVRLTEEGFRDPDLGIAAIAASLSYHPKYLSRIFKQKTGVGYTEYLRSVRIKYATALLEGGLDSIKNVALLSGFADPLYFSTVFKKSVGTSPREYIAARKEKAQTAQP
jgi:AraC-like DNA-binding protein